MSSNEPTRDEIEAVDRFLQAKLVKAVKARHRHCICTTKLPLESTAQFATRQLGRRVDVIEDCTEAELRKLQAIMAGGN